MATQWILLLLFGCVLATPFSRLSPEGELFQKRDEEEDTNVVDKIMKVNVETDEASQLYEGDIYMTKETQSSLNENDKRSNTYRSAKYLWINRRVPYVIDLSLNYLVNNITAAIAEFHAKTCIKWVARTTESYYVKFLKEKGCWSLLGKVNLTAGYQKISLDTGCGSVGTILHEMMHAVGVWHEQSRPDRGTKLEIMWENIVDGKESNFEAHSQQTLNLQGTPYDPDSLMQYGNYAFSKNEKMTLRLLAHPDTVFGQKNGFSNNDILGLNSLYSCSVADGGWSIWSSYSPCDANCFKKRTRFCTNLEKSACNAAIPDGVEHQTATCPHAECYAPVDGHWGRWSSWGKCSASCDEGSHTRIRTCNDPAPKNGGAACVGSNSQTGVCKIKSCNRGPGDCEFDDDASPFCDWKQDETDTQTKHPNFMRGSNTPSGKTGPVGDHTTGSGKFAYAEASGCYNNRGTTVRLQSVEFPATAGRCMTFWYHAKGVQVGQLNVYVRDSNGMSNKFGIAGDQGSEWKQANVAFSHSSGGYQIVLEMVCGGDYRGDVAIDDIAFKDGAC